MKTDTRTSRNLGAARQAILVKLEGLPGKHPILFNGRVRTIAEVLSDVALDTQAGQKFVEIVAFGGK